MVGKNKGADVYMISGFTRKFMKAVEVAFYAARGRPMTASEYYSYEARFNMLAGKEKGTDPSEKSSPGASLLGYSNSTTEKSESQLESERIQKQLKEQAEENRKKKERLEKERAAHNKQVTKDYRLKPKDRS